MATTYDSPSCREVSSKFSKQGFSCCSGVIMKQNIFYHTHKKDLSHLPPNEALLLLLLLLLTFTSDDEFGAITWDLQRYSHQRTHKSSFMVIYLFIF